MYRYLWIILCYSVVFSSQISFSSSLAGRAMAVASGSELSYQYTKNEKQLWVGTWFLGENKPQNKSVDPLNQNFSIANSLNGLQINGLEMGYLIYRLYDLKGNLLLESSLWLLESKLNLDLTPYNRGAYILKLTQNKIQKTQLIHW